MRRAIARWAAGTVASLRNDGLARTLQKAWCLYVGWPILTRRIVRRYVTGQARLARRACGAATELEYTEEIVREGEALARTICARYKGKHRLAGLRVMLHIPPAGAGRVWFEDLAECLEFCGIPTSRLPWDAEELRDSFAEFQPNVFLSFDSPAALRRLDLEFIKTFKAAAGLFRLLSLHDPRGLPSEVELRPTKIRLSPDDEWRLRLASTGRSADAFFCLMDSAYYDLFFKPWHKTNFRYLALPMAANPLQHYPRLIAKDLDWALATNNSDWGARAELTRRYMWDIISSYRGVLVGANWGAGINPIPHGQVPFLLARAKICPSPRIDLSVAYPTEIGGKTFEVTAMGGFLIVSRTAALHKHFRDDEIVSCVTERDFADQFRYYLNRPLERKQHVLRGMARVYRDHTYFHRVDDLVTFIKSAAKN
jgi:hypothetical protein